MTAMLVLNVICMVLASLNGGVAMYLAVAAGGGARIALSLLVLSNFFFLGFMLMGGAFG